MALMTMVDPWIMRSAAAGDSVARAIACMIPSTRSLGVLNALPSATLPLLSSKSVTSVNVPPISTAIRTLALDLRGCDTIACRCRANRVAGGRRSDQQCTLRSVRLDGRWTVQPQAIRLRPARIVRRRYEPIWPWVLGEIAPGPELLLQPRLVPEGLEI